MNTDRAWLAFWLSLGLGGCASTFGGPDLDVMYVTSTTKFLNAYQKRVKLMEGGLLEIRGLGVKGLPEPEFAG